MTDMPPTNIAATVQKFDDKAENCRIVTLAPAAPFSYKAGQYIAVKWSASQEPRYYSIANAPHSTQNAETSVIQLHIKRGGGPASAYIFEHLQKGDAVQISAAQGDNIYDEAAHKGTPLMMIGGGMGFTPLKAMIEEALNCGHEAPIIFIWGSETEDNQYLAPYFKKLEQEHPNFKFLQAIAEPLTSAVFEAFTRYPHGTEPETFLAGPPAMIEALTNHLSAHHAQPRAKIYYDNHPPPPSK